MTKPVNTDAIENTTNISWDEWVKFLDSKNARELEHRQIADLAYEKLKGVLENAGWWSQSVSVAYEQHIGRRVPGQRSDGTYEAAVSRTMEGDMKSVLHRWLHWFDGKEEFNSVQIAKEPNQTQTKINHHWGCGLEDGSRVNVDASLKSADKSLLTITHIKLTSQTEKDKWRDYWKNVLSELE